jgi:hypothetical protein
MSFGSTASESTVVLKATQPYTGVRMTFENVVTSTGELAAHGNGIIDGIESIIVDVPEYGSNSRRVDLDTHTVCWLPTICCLGHAGSGDNMAGTSVIPSTGADAVAGFAYFDIPVNKLNLAEDTRITVKAASSSGSHTLNVSLSFLQSPMKSYFYRAYNVGAGTDSHKQWFPSDAVTCGVAAGTTDGTPAAGTIFNARDSDNLSQVTLNGDQNTTFSNPELLSADLDQAVTGAGSQGAYAALDTYSMLIGFPKSVGPFVQFDRVDSVGLTILGVMHDG